MRVLTPSTPASAARPARRTFGILSTFPPTACGLATFGAALGAGLSARGSQVHLVRIADGSTVADRPVIGELVNGSPASVAAAAGLLNRCEVAVVQHEYGLYGGADGDEVVAVLADLQVPSIVIAHTILRRPTAHQRSVLVDVAALADQVIVMSDAARDRLCNGFDVDPAKVSTIPHGAVVPAGRPRTDPSGRPTLLTWGLVGPGKGIERVIDAMVSLQGLSMRPRYLVAGQTHPKVLAADGEAYRNARIEQAWRNGVAASVSFDSDYRDVASLTRLAQSAAAVVLPYDSTDQVTSGVLVDAIAAGRPVVATAFPHAVELLDSGAGIVVNHDDPDALALALHRVLTEPGLAAAMAAEASRLAPTMSWAVVAGAYLDLAERLLNGRLLAGRRLSERPALV
ncbi:MAG: glycosyltransferase [Acidimicrobiales bacterium]